MSARGLLTFATAALLLFYVVAYPTSAAVLVRDVATGFGDFFAALTAGGSR